MRQRFEIEINIQNGCDIYGLIYMVSDPDNGVTSPKKWGYEQFVFAGAQSKSLYTYMEHLLYIKKTVQRICTNLKRGLSIRGGLNPPISRDVSLDHNNLE